MSEQPKPKSAAGPLLLLFVLLADAGLAVWAWNLYQMRQARYSAAGLNLPTAPQAPVATMNFASPAPSPTPMSDPAKNIIKEAEIAAVGAVPSPSARAAPSIPQPRAARIEGKEATPETRRLIARASDTYFSMKNNPRFKNSPVIKAWKKDFLSYPDLRQIDQDYQKDKDPVRFLVRMVQSPNFKLMLAKYIATPDMQDFLKSMAASPVVMASAKGFLADFNMEAAFKHLPLPGHGNVAPAPDKKP